MNLNGINNVLDSNNNEKLKVKQKPNRKRDGSK